MEIVQKEIGNPLSNFFYALKFRYAGEELFWIIDPYESELVFDLLSKSENGKIVGIINTHSHHDHIRGNQKIISAFPDIQVINFENYNGFSTLKLNQNYFIHLTPILGHTYDHIGVKVFHHEKLHTFFSGDTLFYAGIGNTKNGGDIELLYESVKRLSYEISDEVFVYPGHNYLHKNLLFTLEYDKDNKKARELLFKLEAKEKIYPLKMGEMRQVNLFLKHIENKEKFIQLRKLRDIW